MKASISGMLKRAAPGTPADRPSPRKIIIVRDEESYDTSHVPLESIALAAGQTP